MRSFWRLLAMMASMDLSSWMVCYGRIIAGNQQPSTQFFRGCVDTRCNNTVRVLPQLIQTVILDLERLGGHLFVLKLCCPSRAAESPPHHFSVGPTGFWLIPPEFGDKETDCIHTTTIHSLEQEDHTCLQFSMGKIKLVDALMMSRWSNFSVAERGSEFFLGPSHTCQSSH